MHPTLYIRTSCMYSSSTVFLTLSVRKTVEELYMHEVRMYNVGCMVPGMRYMPRTLDEIVEIDRAVTRVSDIEFAKRKSGHSADSEKITGP